MTTIERMRQGWKLMHLQHSDRHQTLGIANDSVTPPINLSCNSDGLICRICNCDDARPVNWQSQLFKFAHDDCAAGDGPVVLVIKPVPDPAPNYSDDGVNWPY